MDRGGERLIVVDALVFSDQELVAVAGQLPPGRVLKILNSVTRSSGALSRIASSTGEKVIVA